KSFSATPSRTSTIQLQVSGQSCPHAPRMMFMAGSILQHWPPFGHAIGELHSRETLGSELRALGFGEPNLPKSPEPKIDPSPADSRLAWPALPMPCSAFPPH